MTIYLPEINCTGEQLAELSQAIQILERIYPHYDVYFKRAVNSLPTDVIGYIVNKNDSIRDKVINAIREKPCSVAEIEVRTGLDKKRIRGVLSAKELVFKKTRFAGETRYQYEPEIARRPPTNPSIRPTHNPGYLRD